MSDTAAQVHSIDALKNLRDALVTFGEKAQDALCATDLEVRRALDWVSHQVNVWQKRARELEEEVTRTKNELIQRKYWSEGGRGPGYTDQEIAFRKAQQALRDAQQKVENCRRWARTLPQFVNEYRGAAGLLAGMVDSGLQHTVAILDGRIAALEAYLAIMPPSGAGDGGAAAPESAAEPPAALAD